jgi:hypothetical protein
VAGLVNRNNYTVVIFPEIICPPEGVVPVHGKRSVLVLVEDREVSLSCTSDIHIEKSTTMISSTTMTVIASSLTDIVSQTPMKTMTETAPCPAYLTHTCIDWQTDMCWCKDLDATTKVATRTPTGSITPFISGTCVATGAVPTVAPSVTESPVTRDSPLSTKTLSMTPTSNSTPIPSSSPFCSDHQTFREFFGFPRTWWCEDIPRTTRNAMVSF